MRTRLGEGCLWGGEADFAQIRVGMSVGHSPSEPQWAPDMMKSAEEITEEEKKEAKRRIRGSIAIPEDSPDGSGEEEDEQRRMRPSTAPTVDTMAASAM